MLGRNSIPLKKYKNGNNSLNPFIRLKFNTDNGMSFKEN